MNEIIYTGFQGVWYEVILHCRVHLYYVTSLTTNVHVVYRGIRERLWALTDGKCMRPEERKYSYKFIKLWLFKKSFLNILSNKKIYLSWNVLPNWAVLMASLSLRSSPLKI